MQTVQELIATNNLVSDQIEVDELTVILKLLQDTIQKGVAGDVVEFGCYEGTTSLFLQRLLQQTDKTLHVYDSFKGLPEKTRADQSPLGTAFKAGELHASKTTFIKHFRQASLPLPHIHSGWFKDLGTHDIPDQIAFAFLDGDYYESVLTPLKLIETRLTPGAVIVVDDYGNGALPGAKRAVDEWLQTHPVKRFYNQASLGVMIVSAT